MSSPDRDCCLFCGTDPNIWTRMGHDKSDYVISILHKLLQIPISECEKYLDFASPPPGTDWLTLCISCSLMVTEGQDLILQIGLLQDQLVKIQTTLQNQIVNPQNGNTFMTMANTEIFHQLKQDISRRRGTDYTNHQPIAETWHDAANFSSSEQDGSIDDMNPADMLVNFSPPEQEDITIEEIKIECPEMNLDDDFTLSVDPLAMGIIDTEFFEGGGDECENNFTNDGELVNVPKPKKAKVTNTKTLKNTKPHKYPAPIKYNPNVDYSTASIEFFQTSRGKLRLVVNGYTYRFDKLGTNKRLWPCHRQRRGKCKARLHTTESLSPVVILGQLGTHNHDLAPLPRKKKVTKIRDASTTASESSPTMTMMPAFESTIDDLSETQFDYVDQDNAFVILEVL